MGVNRPLTFGPDEMTRLKDIVLGGEFKMQAGGAYEFVENFPARYIADLTKRPKLKRKIKVVCACGNGTAGAFAPRGAQSHRLRGDPARLRTRHTFPNYNPNTEDMKMLHAMRDAVLAHKADVALGFDGDGDRCGVVDNEGDEIFADKVGVMLARDISSNHKDALFVADVKSTGLFMTDPVLIANGAKTEYWKTGHSYMKRRVNEIGALAGFEKSGHFFFNKPFGRGYDDGLIFALAVCDMLDRNPAKSMADLKNALPKTWSSPTMSPHCADETKYGVVDAVVQHFTALEANGGAVAGQKNSRQRQGRRFDQPVHAGAPKAATDYNLPVCNDEGRDMISKPKTLLACGFLHVLSGQRILVVGAQRLLDLRENLDQIGRRFHSRGRGRRRSCSPARLRCRVRCAEQRQPARPYSGRSRAACTRRPYPSGVLGRRPPRRVHRSVEPLRRC